MLLLLNSHASAGAPVAAGYTDTYVVPTPTFVVFDETDELVALALLLA